MTFSSILDTEFEGSEGQTGENNQYVTINKGKEQDLEITKKLGHQGSETEQEIIQVKDKNKSQNFVGIPTNEWQAEEGELEKENKKE